VFVLENGAVMNINIPESFYTQRPSIHLLKNNLTLDLSFGLFLPKTGLKVGNFGMPFRALKIQL
jgi:hypothetical protein